MKRCFDIIASVLGLICFSPMMLIIALLVLATDGLPVLFRQQRIGKDGRPFTMLKFRSMRNLQNKNAAKITVSGDSRITPMGRLLRKTKLDELPQLANVLTGQMSLVGPRPEVKEYVERYSESQRKVLELKPGITDPASLKYFNEEEILAQSDDPARAYVEKVMPDKIRLNLEYAQNASLLRDIGIILKTVFRILQASEKATPTNSTGSTA